MYYSKIKYPPSSRVWTSAFAHRNPPRSLWLQHIHWMCCYTRRAHTAVPPLHSERLQYKSAESRATALCAPGVANNTAQALVLRTQGLPHGKNKRTSACISKMKAKFLSCGKRSTKNQGEQLQLVVVEAKGACVRRKLGAPRLAAVAARNPSR